MSDTYESRRSYAAGSAPTPDYRRASVGPSRSIRTVDITREGSPTESQEEDELSDERADAPASFVSGYKARHRPTPQQLDELRQTFEQYTHPSRQERERLARVTGL
jgi:hypothetical protein